MKNIKNFSYPLVVGILAILIFLMMQAGQLNNTGIAAAQNQLSSFEIFWREFTHHLEHPLGKVLLQIITIIIFSRFMGALLRKIGQPMVIGEILSGIMLGPSLVGLFFPEFNAFLFPPETLTGLQYLSHLGLILFMFIIGMELDVSVIKKNAREAIIISHSAIAFSFFLGTTLAYFTFQKFSVKGADFLHYALFMGISMSITAFPVLARVVQERGLGKKNTGVLAITCAAVDDLTAWCLLAVVIAVVKAGDAVSALFTVGLALAYVGAMILVIQPFFAKIGEIYISKENLNKTVVAFVFVVLMISSYIAEIIGIHALFGAFLAGTVMPQNIKFKEILTQKIEDLGLVLLLPLFFVITGLRTQIGLLNTPELWLMCLVVMGVAIAGKFFGASLSARMVGYGWQNSFALGALMNTRGLMELIVLNIGYELGILSGEMFAMLVLMAISTTFMTGPLLDLVEYVFKGREKGAESTHFRLLISFGQPQMGKQLLNLANAMGLTGKEMPAITALHLTPTSEITLTDAALFEREGFAPIREKAEELHTKLEMLYRATDKVKEEIIKTANENSFDMLLVGSARSIFNENVISGVIKNVVQKSNCAVGVLMDKKLEHIHKIMVLVFSKDDEFLLSVALRFTTQTGSHTDFYDLSKSFSDFSQKDKFSHHFEQFPEGKQMQEYDLILVGLEAWESESEKKSSWINTAPSILIVKKSYEENDNA